MAGRQIQQTDAFGQFSTTLYEDLATGLATNTTDARQNARAAASRKSLVMAHDSAGHSIGVTDASGNLTITTFDSLARKTSETQVGTTPATTYTRSWAYVDLKTTYTDRIGRITVTVSDPVHDQSTETWYAIGDVAQATPLRTITTLSNVAGDPVSITDMAATSQSVWSAAYDDLGRMTTSSQSFYVGGATGGVTSPTQNFTYGYTSNGDRNVMTLGLNGPGGTISASSGFDNLNRTTRLTQTVDGRTLQVGIGYLADGRLDTITRSRGVDAGSLATVTKAAFVYRTTDGQLNSLTHSDGSATPVTLTQYMWTYDNNHRVNQKSYTRTLGNVSDAHNYTYDASGQISILDGVTQTYDDNGNTASAGTVVAKFNELTNDGTNTYTFDKEGHRLTRTVTATGIVSTYDYEANSMSCVPFLRPPGTMENAHAAIGAI